MLNADTDDTLRTPADAPSDDPNARVRRLESLPSQSLNNGVGWIQVVREAPPARPLGARGAPPTSMSLPHDELSSARGIAIGVAFGLGAWALLASVFGILFF